MSSSGAFGQRRRERLVPDAPSPLTPRLAAAQIHRVLVRPDGYVCWVGSGSDASSGAALRRWFGAPSRRRVGTAGVSR